MDWKCLDGTGSMKFHVLNCILQADLWGWKNYEPLFHFPQPLPLFPFSNTLCTPATICNRLLLFATGSKINAYKQSLPLYKFFGTWHVCPHPLEQHFFTPEHSLSASQLSTQAAAKPLAFSGAGQSPCFTDKMYLRNSQLVKHSQFFLGKRG